MSEKYNPEVYAELFKKTLEGLKHEEIHAMALDENGEPEVIVRLAIGDGERVFFDARIVLLFAQKYNAKAIVLAHNHPRGLALPSTPDLMTTELLGRILDAYGIGLMDHIIVAHDSSWCSIRKLSEAEVERANALKSVRLMAAN